MTRGFTIIELLISIAIFTFMTVLVVVKYGNFNESTLLTDTAYDVALAVHTAQTYGLSVKNASANFNSAYGISFSSLNTNTCGASSASPTKLVLFADITADGVCRESPDAAITTFAVTRGATIDELCSGDSESDCDPKSRLDISFLRPNPEADIRGDSANANGADAYARITIRGRDGSTRGISVRRNGQVSVVQY